MKQNQFPVTLSVTLESEQVQPWFDFPFSLMRNSLTLGLFPIIDGLCLTSLVTILTLYHQSHLAHAVCLKSECSWNARQVLPSKFRDPAWVSWIAKGRSACHHLGHLPHVWLPPFPVLNVSSLMMLWAWMQLFPWKLYAIEEDHNLQLKL